MFIKSAVIVTFGFITSCVPIIDLAPAHRVEREACARIVFTGWDGDDIPTCDLDGSQTWVLSDEATDMDLSDPTTYCNDRGGIHAVSPTDPTTHYCFNLDY